MEAKSIEFKLADSDGTFIYALGPGGTNSFQAHIQASGPDALTLEDRQSVARMFAESGEMLNALELAVNIIDKAGLMNLSNGVQLGATSWYVKASGIFDYARDVIRAAKGE